MWQLPPKHPFVAAIASVFVAVAEQYVEISADDGETVAGVDYDANAANAFQDHHGAEEKLFAVIVAGFVAAAVVAVADADDGDDDGDCGVEEDAVAKAAASAGDDGVVVVYCATNYQPRYFPAHEQLLSHLLLQCC